MGSAATAIDQAIARFGESVKHFFRGQKRSEMTSPLFNLPGRLLLGSYCYYENLPPLLDEIAAAAQPEDIGHAMKRLCMRPNYVHLNSLALGYLVGREQTRLTGGCVRHDADRTAAVMEFWSGTARAYRNDGRLLPEQTGQTVPVLTPAAVSELAGQLLGEGMHRQVHRMVATVELYTFIFHGEARVGVFHHGPYPLDGGDTLVVKELVGLGDRFYGWARQETRLPCSDLACVMRLRGVRSRIDLFGALTTEPADYADRIVDEALFAAVDGGYRLLPADMVPAMTQAAGDAQLELYRRALEWDEAQRIRHGAELYGYLLKCFGDIAGLGEAFSETIRSRFAESVGRHLEALRSGAEQALVLRHIADTPGPLFAPLGRLGENAA